MKNKNFVITKTPLRISFAGGGTDFQNYFCRFGGHVVSSAIDKYVYVTVKRHDFGVNPEKYRLNYYSSEHVNHLNDIKNNIIRSVLKFMNFDDPLFISTIADVPAYSGLGSSSAFTVGLLRAIYELKGEEVSNFRLAEEACHIEINILGSPIGKQDQFATAIGGLNQIIFKRSNLIEINPINMERNKINFIFDNLMFFSTKLFRSANDVLKEQNANHTKAININNLNQIKSHASKVYKLFVNNFTPNALGLILNETWENKKKLAFDISNKNIDIVYKKALESGALGGKISGAGGGGFLMLVVPPELRKKVRASLINFPVTKITYDNKGSRTLYKE